MFVNRLNKLCVVAVMGLALAQCGEQGALSKDVKTSFIPENPLVVHADLTFIDVNGDEFTIKSPWFRLGFRVENNSDNRLYLAAFILDGKTNGPSGKKTFSSATDTGRFCENRGYIAVMEPGAVYERVTLCDAYTPVSGGAAGSRYEDWYFSSLPESINDIYSIEITGEGWFVNSDNVPIERLVSYGFLITQ